jgi:hypothetical protein
VAECDSAFVAPFSMSEKIHGKQTLNPFEAKRDAGRTTHGEAGTIAAGTGANALSPVRFQEFDELHRWRCALLGGVT